ncbi:hypothetical protein AHAS_Ahas16G0164600 [Arachis hypogaea]
MHYTRSVLHCTCKLMSFANTPSETPSSQEQGSTTDASIGTQKNNNRAKNDPAWDHCKQVVESGKTILLCIYCEKLIRGGGIHRFKLHLAGKGGDVESCRKVPTAVRHQFHESIEELRSKKRKTQEQYAESYNACDDVEREFDEIERNEMQQQQKSRVPTSISRKGKQVKGLQSYFPSATTPGAQPTIKSVLQSKKIVEKCDIAIAKWIVDASVPFNAVNSAYYQPMIDAIASMGAGYKGPSYPRVRRDVVLFVGLENVVHIVTDNAANYVAAGRLLEAEFPKLYWSPCAAHCVNLMFQDIGKLQEVSQTMSQASLITKYIYNHCSPLFLMRKFTDGQEILRPAPTRFATNFIALQSILAQKDPLRAMVTSKEFTSSAYSKEAKAKKFVDQVLDSKFWSQCTDIVKLTSPLVHVLRIVDSEDRPAMGYLYQAIYKAREEMVRRFQKRKKHKETISGLLDVIEKYAYDDPVLNSKLTSEKRIFKNAEKDFGRPSAIRERTTVMPDQWWESYGCGAPNLQKLAIRVLSQTCSSSGCEHQLDLEDDREDDGANNSVKNANQNETNQDVAPHLSDEEQLADFEITPWI